VNRAWAGTRFSLSLIGAFVAIGALLADVGLCVALSTAGRQRTAEIGFRMALGLAAAESQPYFEGWTSVDGCRHRVGVIAAIALTCGITAMLLGINAPDATTSLRWR
jgi:putative ABC transport system permease protein